MKIFKRILLAIIMVLVGALILSGTALAKERTVKVGALQPDWTLGVYSAYYGPPDYNPVSPGSTAKYLGREAGIIKAGLALDPTYNDYEDEGLFAFKPAVTIEKFIAHPLTYSVANQYGQNPVWMTIELEIGDPNTRDDNVTFQMVPPPYGLAKYVTIDARKGTWYKWNNDEGDITGNPAMSLQDIALTYPGVTVIRTYLRLGIGDSYGPGPNGTQAWVDKVSIGEVTYDFVKGKGAPKPKP
jgi:hypothetical protein